MRLRRITAEAGNSQVLIHLFIQVRGIRESNSAGCPTLHAAQEWRDSDWFKTRVPDQTQERRHFIQTVNRPSPSTLGERKLTAFLVAPGPCVTQNPCPKSVTVGSDTSHCIPYGVSSILA